MEEGSVLHAISEKYSQEVVSIHGARTFVLYIMYVEVELVLFRPRMGVVGYFGVV